MLLPPLDIPAPIADYVDTVSAQVRTFLLKQLSMPANATYESFADEFVRAMAEYIALRQVCEQSLHATCSTARTEMSQMPQLAHFKLDQLRTMLAIDRLITKVRDRLLRALLQDPPDEAVGDVHTVLKRFVNDCCDYVAPRSKECTVTVARTFTEFGKELLAMPVPYESAGARGLPAIS